MVPQCPILYWLVTVKVSVRQAERVWTQLQMLQAEEVLLDILKKRLLRTLRIGQEKAKGTRHNRNMQQTDNEQQIGAYILRRRGDAGGTH